jgi:chemotaxis protein methyltransferase WspC
MLAAASHHSPLCPIEAFLQQSIGLDHQTIGSAAIARAVRVRIEASGEPDEAAFLARISRDAEEHDRFIDEVVVPESWFFRDTQVFDFIRGFASSFAAAPGRPPIRILCVPCAGGEEPYSVAMAFFEAGLTAQQFRIDAADVSRAALERAAAATYSPNAFRAADFGFRDRWFHCQGAAATLDDAVRKQVHFSWGNLLDTSFAAERESYDIVFCRNLLIYLTADARNRVEQTLDRLLVPDGLLVLGAAEPPILKGPWVPAAGNAMFTLRRGPPSANDFPTASPSRRPATAASLGRMMSGNLSADIPSPNNPPRSPVEDPLAPRPLAAADLLRDAENLADAGRRAEALALCQQHAKTIAPCPKIFFLMGMLHQAAGDLDRAESCLHKTLYLDANHDEALLALALLATQRGDSRMADRYRQSAARVLARKGAS